MNRLLLKQVRQMAGDRCEYCRIPRAYDPLPFQADHIIAQQHGGATVLENFGLELPALQQAQGTEHCGPRSLHRAVGSSLSSPNAALAAAFPLGWPNSRRSDPHGPSHHSRAGDQ
jgi:hypothetical protein